MVTNKTCLFSGKHHKKKKDTKGLQINMQKLNAGTDSLGTSVDLG